MRPAVDAYKKDSTAEYDRILWSKADHEAEEFFRTLGDYLTAEMEARDCLPLEYKPLPADFEGVRTNALDAWKNVLLSLSPKDLRATRDRLYTAGQEATNEVFRKEPKRARTEKALEKERAAWDANCDEIMKYYSQLYPVMKEVEKELADKEAEDLYTPVVPEVLSAMGTFNPDNLDDVGRAPDSAKEADFKKLWEAAKAVYDATRKTVEARKPNSEEFYDPGNARRALDL